MGYFSVLRLCTMENGVKEWIDLLSLKTGFIVTDWVPASLELKDGGIFTSGPFADGRRIIQSTYSNITDTFTLTVNSTDMDMVIENLRKLRQMLQKGVQYWTTDWLDYPVWLEIQGSSETNLRYAVMMAWSAPGDGNPFATPFFETDGVNSSSAIENFALTIEHTHWCAYAPGSFLQVPCGAHETYNGIDVGNLAPVTGAYTPVTDWTAYIANKDNMANLTDIYSWDVATGFSGNLHAGPMGGYSYFKAPFIAGNICYFGINTGLANSGPFCSLVLNLATRTLLTTYAWEYWNGGAWAALAVQDNTNAAGAMTGNALDTLGICSIHWSQPANWATLAVNGVVGWWIRLRVLVVNPGDVSPTQAAQRAYSITWPYTEILGDVVPGDIASLLRLKMLNCGATVATRYSNRLFVGLRSASRGLNFTPYLNISDIQNNANVTVIALAGAFANSPITPTGRIYSNAPGAGAGSFVSVRLNPTLSPEYRGYFRMFLRAKRTGGVSTDIGLRMSVIDGQVLLPATATDYFYIPTTDDFYLIDYGLVRFGAADYQAEATEFLRLNVQYTSTGAGVTITLYDIILMPVDEWAGEFVDTFLQAVTTGDPYVAAGGFAASAQYLDIDSIRTHKHGFTRSCIRSVVTDYRRTRWQAVTPGPAVLQSEVRQRLWFLSSKFPTADVTAPEVSLPYCSYRIDLEANPRYFNMRGSS